MADNYYSEINLHLTWHTKLSRPLLRPEIEAMAYACLREKVAKSGRHLCPRDRRHREPRPFGGHDRADSQDFGDDWSAQGLFVARGESSQRVRPNGAPVAGRLWRRQLRNERSAVGRRVHPQSEGTSCEWQGIMSGWRESTASTIVPPEAEADEEEAP